MKEAHIINWTNLSLETLDLNVRRKIDEKGQPTIEFWCPVKNYEGLYEVSSWGRVLNLRTNRMQKQVTDKGGTMSVPLTKDGVRVTCSVSRLVAKALIPNIDWNLQVVDHRDGNKANNHFTNLQWVSYATSAQYNRNRSEKFRNF